jgi:hypothetical protein
MKVLREVSVLAVIFQGKISSFVMKAFVEFIAFPVFSSIPF